MSIDIDSKNSGKGFSGLLSLLSEVDKTIDKLDIKATTIAKGNPSHKENNKELSTQIESAKQESNTHSSKKEEKGNKQLSAQIETDKNEPTTLLSHKEEGDKAELSSLPARTKLILCVYNKRLSIFKEFIKTELKPIVINLYSNQKLNFLSMKFWLVLISLLAILILMMNISEEGNKDQLQSQALNSHKPVTTNIPKTEVSSKAVETEDETRVQSSLLKTRPTSSLTIKQNVEQQTVNASIKTIPEAEPQADKSLMIIQKKLNELGYKAGDTDGFMNQKTSSAILNFQHDNGLTETGLINSNLIVAILNKMIKSNTVNTKIKTKTKTKTKTSKKINNPIMMLQTRLNELGYNAGLADGIMGKKTRIAIDSFKNEHRLQVDAKTMKIFSLIKKVTNGKSVPNFNAKKVNTASVVEKNYGKPVLNQVSSVEPNPIEKPDLSQFSILQRLAIERVCSSAKKYEGIAKYYSCLKKEKDALNSFNGKPDLSQFSFLERKAIEKVCDSANNNQGPAAYYSCLKREKDALNSLNERPDLSHLSKSQQRFVENACIAAKRHHGPADYYLCIKRVLTKKDVLNLY